MKKTRYYLLIIICLAGLTSRAISPSYFHKALKKLYPSAAQVGWSQQGNYYVAAFTLNDFEKQVWMNGKAQWIMTVTDIGTADELPPRVYNTFMLGAYAQWTVENVNSIEFPKGKPVYSVKVNQDNSVSTYRLIYTSNGQLILTQNLSYTSGGITPNLFSFR